MVYIKMKYLKKYSSPLWLGQTYSQNLQPKLILNVYPSVYRLLDTISVVKISKQKTTLLCKEVPNPILIYKVHRNVLLSRFC